MAAPWAWQPAATDATPAATEAAIGAKTHTTHSNSHRNDRNIVMCATVSMSGRLRGN